MRQAERAVRRRWSWWFGAVAAVAVLVPAVPAVADDDPPTEAGVTLPDPVLGQVVNGQPASPSEFPWIVALLVRTVSDPFQAQFCGGARVGPTRIVTAAHCTYDPGSGLPLPPSSIDVLSGTATLTPGSGTRETVTAIDRHPAFSFSPSGSWANDVAVLTVPDPGVPVPTVEVITPQSENRSTPGLWARVAGWGCAEQSPGTDRCTGYPLSLRRADVPMRSPATCTSFYGAVFSAGAMLCAATSSTTASSPSACDGDSGGPLVVRGPNGDLLAGVVSFGVTTCGVVPFVSTRLAAYRDWLAQRGVPTRPDPFSGRPLAPQVNLSYQPLVGDFEGDGRDDVLWYAPGTAGDYLWTGSGAGPVPGGSVRQVNGTYRPLVGDVDGDGRDDVLWYAPGPGPEYLWMADPSAPGRFRDAPVPRVNGTYEPQMGDFDGDGRDDVFWYAPGTAAEYLWRADPSAPAAFVSSPAGPVNGSYRPAAGDFDGDGRDDVFWYAPGPAADYLWVGSPGGPTPGPSTLQVRGTYRLLAADGDGDGVDDLVMYGAGTAFDVLWRGSPGGFVRETDLVVNGTYVPAAGDFDGDGRDDLLWHGPGSAADYWWRGVAVP